MPSFDRSDILKLAGSTAVGSIRASALSETVAAGHVSQDMPVVCSFGLKILKSASTDAEVLGTASQWTGGEIVDGSREVDGYIWWEVAWNQDEDNGDITGWSIKGDDWIAGPTDFAVPC